MERAEFRLQLKTQLSMLEFLCKLFISLCLTSVMFVTVNYKYSDDDDDDNNSN